MEFIIFMTLPGLAILILLVTAVDQLLQRLGRTRVLPWWKARGSGTISGTAFEGLDGSLGAGGKHHELEERKTALMLRDDEEDGAPPNRTTVDLDSRTAVIRMTGQADQRSGPQRAGHELALPCTASSRSASSSATCSPSV